MPASPESESRIAWAILVHRAAIAKARKMGADALVKELQEKLRKLEASRPNPSIQ